MDTLSQHIDRYKQALKDKNSQALLREKAWLTTAAASALLNQDIEAMRKIRACCADLSSLADHFDITGRPGDRWRTLGDVLTLALESGKPLEQLRLALPATVSGQIMQLINTQPGITPTEISKIRNTEPPNVSNALKRLENAGLIYRFKRGKTHELFLSILGKEALDSVAPMENQEKSASGWGARLSHNVPPETTHAQNESIWDSHVRSNRLEEIAKNLNAVRLH